MMGDIADRFDAWLATQDNPPQPSNNVHASHLDDTCYRRVVYSVACPEKASSPPSSLQPVFWMGRALQQVWAGVLNQIGYEVVEQMSYRVWPAYDLSGSVDFRVRCPDGQRRILEFKTIGRTFDRINEPADLLRLDMPYHAWYGQVQTYCILYGYSECILLIQEKSSGRVKDWLVPLDYAYADSLIAKAEVIPMWIERWQQDKEDLPPRITNGRECDRCRFGHICLPDWQPKTAEFVDDQEFLDALAEQEKLKEFTRQREDVMDFIARYVGDREMLMAPGWLLRRKFVPAQTIPPKPRGGYYRLDIKKTGGQ